MGHLTHPVWRLAPALVLLTGCWMRTEKQMMEREETMGGHLIALFDAAAALEADDDARFRSAMKDLEKGGELPGIEADAGLEMLHAAAKDLKTTSDRGARATGVMHLAAQCSACHAGHGVTTPALFDPTTPAENALGAVVWQDEPRWNDAWTALGHDETPATWEARSAALARVLGGVPRAP